MTSSAARWSTSGGLPMRFRSPSAPLHQDNRASTGAQWRWLCKLDHPSVPWEANPLSEGSGPETLRLYRPGSIVAFGPRDTKAPGCVEAVRAARSGGFEAVKRLGGGRAAVFHDQTIAFAWTIPDPGPHASVLRRFQELANIMANAFLRLGIDARVGEVPGEYCPGRYSGHGVGPKLDSLVKSLFRSH